MISKELLIEVLPYPKNEFVEFIKQNDDFIKYGARLQDQISIYELAHKCKEWARENHYIILSKNMECLIYHTDNIYDVIECLEMYEDYFQANTEYEAIFKACQWIYDNTKQGVQNAKNISHCIN